MGDELKGEGVVKMAELIMAVRDYENEEEQRWEKGIDIIASPIKSDDKILMRVITKPSSKSGVIGATAVREMGEELERKGYDKVFLIGKRFTKGAREVMSQEGIEMVSEKIMPSFKPQRLYVTIHNCINHLCRAKCGHVPREMSDCKGYSGGHYSCEIRLISDNAQFHFERGWTNLLQKDLEQLLTIGKSASNQRGGKRMDD
ncbi:MAG: restriction endonuclease [Candidatus Bathyarchaeia archaeon]